LLALCLLGIAAVVLLIPLPFAHGNTASIEPLVITALVVVCIACVLFWVTAHKPLTLAEGAASNIRSHARVQSAKSLIRSTSFIHLLIDQTAAFAEFAEQMPVNEGDRLRVAGYPQASGLKIYAFHNLTNNTQGENGLMRRAVGGLVVCIGLMMGFIEDDFPLAGAILLVLTGIWIIGRGYRYRNALKACLAQTGT